ncbi:MAG: Multicopper polyphenol oxidase [Candidatus Rifleibacterium amylolyticum]|nr:MAG: Multicopper polyphenol oxidase [Candidatus Rifleibacterium amylolyticum]
MKLFEDGKILMGFSDSGDGDLSLYNMSVEQAENAWNSLDVVNKHGLKSPAWAIQVHGNKVLPVREFSEKVISEQADAVITDLVDQPAGVFSADCLPILIYSARVCAAVHAGWRSTRQNIAASAVQAFSNVYGESADRLKAYIGPCIGQCCLEMGDEVYDEFVGEDSEYARFFLRRGKWHLDLRALNRFQLVRAGVRSENITDFDRCTFCHADEYYSFRRQRQRNGSMFSFIVNRSRN